MRSKNVFNLIILVFMLYFLIACSFGQIEDTNGIDDYTIQSFTDSDITSKSSYSSIGSVTTSFNNKTKIKINKFSGIYELESTKVINQSLVYNIESICSIGNFRIVIIYNGQIIRDVKINSNETITIENANGNYILKMVGESAKIEIVYSINKIN